MPFMCLSSGARSPFRKPTKRPRTWFLCARKRPASRTRSLFPTKGYAEHAPRIKIAVDPPHTFNATSKSASMAIHDHSIRGESVAPHIAEQVKQFIDLNREALLDYWD